MNEHDPQLQLEFESRLEVLLTSVPEGQGIFGVCVFTPDGQSFGMHSSEVFPAASVIKVPIMLAVLQAVQTGQLELETRYLVQDADRVSGSGVLFELSSGLNPTLHDLLHLMMVVSDNMATNLLIDLLGVDQINHFLEPYPQTRLIGKLQLPKHLRNNLQKQGLRNQTSPQDMARMLLELVQGQLLNPQLTRAALDMLERQQYKHMIARYLPWGDEEVAVRVASKSGEIQGTRNDVGVVWLNSAPSSDLYALAILSKGIADIREHPENAGMILGGQISRLVWDMLSGL
jgi:beta-lactamase class A